MEGGREGEGEVGGGGGRGKGGEGRGCKGGKYSHDTHANTDTHTDCEFRIHLHK